MRASRTMGGWLLLTLVSIVGCRPSAREVAKRQCMAGCEQSNHHCMLDATSAHAIDRCTGEVSRCLAYCQR